MPTVSNPSDPDLWFSRYILFKTESYYNFNNIAHVNINDGLEIHHYINHGEKVVRYATCIVCKFFSRISKAYRTKNIVFLDTTTNINREKEKERVAAFEVIL